MKQINDIKYNKYNITFTTQSPTDHIDLQKMRKEYDLMDKDIIYEFKRIQRATSRLTKDQQKAVVYLYDHLYGDKDLPFVNLLKK